LADLRFHDLRRGFACRLLESRAELHDLRDFLGHANITTTSRHLRSTTLLLERALGLLERAEQEKTNGARARNKMDSGESATSVPHESVMRAAADAQSDPEVIDVIEDVLVSPAEIEPSRRGSLS
jgi:Phage integrase family